MALRQALCGVTHRPGGVRHRQWRPPVAARLGTAPAPATAGPLTYDRRRRRRTGLMPRIAGPPRSTGTTSGLHVALVYATVARPIRRPGWAALTAESPAIPTPLRHARARGDTEIGTRCAAAQRAAPAA